jgi:hypothetical protein
LWCPGRRHPFFNRNSARAAAERATGTGTIEGRVFNPGTGEYLERARVTLEGTALETFTDNLGNTVSSTSPLARQGPRVLHRPGDPDRAGPRERGPDGAAGFQPRGFAKPPGDVVQLSKYVVETRRRWTAPPSRSMRKRFAADIRNVIAADEFGPMADGNVGELLKTVPGVAIDYVGGSAMASRSTACPRATCRSR